MSAGGGAARPKFPLPGETFAPAEFSPQLFGAVDRARDIGDCAKRLLLLAMRLAGTSTWCQVTGRWLAEALAKSQRQVWEAMRKLEAAGYIARESRGLQGVVLRFLWKADYERFLQLTSQTVRKSSQMCGNPHRNCAEIRTDPMRKSAHIHHTHQIHQERESSARELGNLEADGLFARLWERHPKKRGRYLAEQALAQVLAEAPDPAELAPRIEQVHAAWADSHEWRKQGGRFAPQLHRWLLDRGWLDGPPPAEEDELPVFGPNWEDSDARVDP